MAWATCPSILLPRLLSLEASSLLRVLTFLLTCVTGWVELAPVLKALLLRDLVPRVLVLKVLVPKVPWVGSTTALGLGKR